MGDQLTRGERVGREVIGGMQVRKESGVGSRESVVGRNASRARAPPGTGKAERARRNGQGGTAKAARVRDLDRDPPQRIRQKVEEEDALPS